MCVLLLARRSNKQSAPVRRLPWATRFQFPVLLLPQEGVHVQPYLRARRCFYAAALSRRRLSSAFWFFWLVGLMWDVHLDEIYRLARFNQAKAHAPFAPPCNYRRNYSDL
jgi:hypothetical protein